MRAMLLIIALITLPPLAQSSALATRFSFDPASGTPLTPANYIIPIAVVAIVSFVGALLIVSERKKAKGIWFSNGERLK